jgi:hypothetical protein
MDRTWIYEIRIEGHLANRWSDWFEGMAVYNKPGGETVLSGPLTDQAALLGIINKIHALNLSLISINRSTSNKSETQST